VLCTPGMIAGLPTWVPVLPMSPTTLPPPEAEVPELPLESELAESPNIAKSEKLVVVQVTVFAEVSTVQLLNSVQSES